VALVAADQLKLTVAVAGLLPCPASQASLLAGRLNADALGGGGGATGSGSPGRIPASSVEQLNNIPAKSAIKRELKEKRVVTILSLL
jgi:hypothetical protein